MKILIIEDDQAIRKTLHELLNLNGFSVISMQNGAEGVFYLKKCIEERAAFPDLVLLDLNMPVMDGFEFLALMQESEWHLVPVLVMSAQASFGSVQGLPELGDFFLKKPFEIDLLLEKVHCVRERLQKESRTNPGLDVSVFDAVRQKKLEI